MKRLIVIAALLLGSAAHAQTPNPVTTQPKGVTTQNSSGTIAVTNTFQTIWSKSSNVQGRLGCYVQNKGSNPMYVYFGPKASATTPTSINLSGGAAISCANGVIVQQDEVNITGTAGDAYYAGQN